MTSKLYTEFYSKLKLMREKFHKMGRFDDSNAKLDEVIKLIAIYLYELRKQDNHNRLRQILNRYKQNPDYDIVIEVKRLFKKIIHCSIFQSQSGEPIFSPNSQLNIHNHDKDFAFDLISLVINSIDNIEELNENGNKFDIINESFGHFVRDNFRNNVEDAQYMTPPEVVEFMCKIAIHDLKNQTQIPPKIKILDPTCGVGSFLATFYRFAKKDDTLRRINIQLYGQDKVDRMIRLSKINMLLFNTENHFINCGNSLLNSDFLNELNGKVDCILTNPPFGAIFSAKEISLQPKDNFPYLHDLSINNRKVNFNSELLFIDRNLSLLKEKGQLLIIIPDSVVSSRGMALTLRERLQKRIKLRAIIELPTVTFAQAGTRTNTSILYFTKESPDLKNDSVFIAQCKEIGFEVGSRKGAPIKVIKGKNDLEEIAAIFENTKKDTKKSYKIIAINPPCVLLKRSQITSKYWTPSHFNALKYRTIEELKESSNSNIKIFALKELVNFVTPQRRHEIVPSKFYCISVKHISIDGLLNFTELYNYHPKYPGIVCKPGDILFSKINPRIPRMLVVPDLSINFTCSSEFEIMSPKASISNHGIILLLTLEEVQKQIKSMTTGTSSSHNRIKTSSLENVLIPVPKRGTLQWNKLHQKIVKFSQEISNLNKHFLELYRIKNSAMDFMK